MSLLSIINNNVVVGVSPEELSPTVAEQQKREQILASLERFIRKEFNGKLSELCPGPDQGSPGYYQTVLIGSFLCHVFFSPDKAQLCLFGSSKNGFGFRDSDLDICMTLEGHQTAEVCPDYHLLLLLKRFRCRCLLM